MGQLGAVLEELELASPLEAEDDEDVPPFEHKISKGNIQLTPQKKIENIGKKHGLIRKDGSQNMSKFGSKVSNYK